MNNQSTITLNPGQMLKSAQELKQSLSQIAPDESKTTKIVTFALVATALGALTGFYDEKIKPTIESKSTEYKTLLQENFARRANTQQAIVPLLNMRKLLKKILAEAEDEIDEMAAVQAFEVDQKAHYLIADLLNQKLPLPSLREKKNFNPTDDADYRTLLADYQEQYGETLPEAEQVAHEIAYEYLLMVIKSLVGTLKGFTCHEPEYMKGVV
ncbi:169_t:CDS:2 [Entrophospora sp. SA101]|nr:169_t:CDS:2 [Entrophospora sp. SA101]